MIATGVSVRDSATDKELGVATSAIGKGSTPGAHNIMVITCSATGKELGV